MKTAEQIRQEITNEQGHLKMPPLAFILCLAISAMLWVFVTLSREYTVTYDYKVNCIELPAGKNKANVSTGDASTDLRLTFKAKGFALLNPAFRESNRTIDLSVEQLVKHKGEKLNSYQFTQTELTDYLKESGIFGEEFVKVESPSMTVYLSK